VPQEGWYVTKQHGHVVRFRGLPRSICTDQKAVFTGNAFDEWTNEHGIELRLIVASERPVRIQQHVPAASRRSLVRNVK
jgi:hypothetical protein